MTHIQGLGSLMKKFDKIGGNSAAVMANSIRKSTNIVLRDAKKNAPVNKKGGGGALRQSIQAQTKAGLTGIEGKVFTNCEYAPYVEYGTGQRGDPKVAHATDWIGMEAQPYLYPALNNNKEIIKESIRNDLRNAIKKAGG